MKSERAEVASPDARSVSAAARLCRAAAADDDWEKREAGALLAKSACGAASEARATRGTSANVAAVSAMPHANADASCRRVDHAERWPPRAWAW